MNTGWLEEKRFLDQYQAGTSPISDEDLKRASEYVKKRGWVADRSTLSGADGGASGPGELATAPSSSSTSDPHRGDEGLREAVEAEIAEFEREANRAVAESRGRSGVAKQTAYIYFRVVLRLQAALSDPDTGGTE